MLQVLLASAGTRLPDGPEQSPRVEVGSGQADWVRAESILAQV